MEGRQRRSFTDDYKRQAVDLGPVTVTSYAVTVTVHLIDLNVFWRVL